MSLFASSRRHTHINRRAFRPQRMHTHANEHAHTHHNACTLIHTITHAHSCQQAFLFTPSRMLIHANEHAHTHHNACSLMPTTHHTACTPIPCQCSFLPVVTDSWSLLSSDWAFFAFTIRYIFARLGVCIQNR